MGVREVYNYGIEDACKVLSKLIICHTCPFFEKCKDGTDCIKFLKEYVGQKMEESWNEKDLDR